MSTEVSAEPMPGAPRRGWAVRRAAAIGAGGALGAGCRWVAFAALPSEGVVPWTTLLVNVAGSMLLGALLAGERPRSSHATWLLLHDAGAIGFCGGFTTFATYALDIVDLVRTEQVASAVGYGTVTLIGALAGLLLGAAAVRRWDDAGRAVEEVS